MDAFFKEGGEYPLGWDLAQILRPNRPHYHLEEGAQLSNSLGELNPYTTTSFQKQMYFWGTSTQFNDFS